MNGKWSFLLKAVLITTPAAWAIFVTVDLPWRVWVTRSTFTSLEYNANARDCMQRIEQFLRDHEAEYKVLERRVDKMPPQDYRDRVYLLEQFERENKADHANILVSLEAIKAQLGIHRNKDKPPGGAKLPYQPGASHATASKDDDSGNIAADPSG